MRATTIITFLCLFTAAYCQSHDLILGKVTSDDVAIFKIIEFKFACPWIVRTSIIDFPTPGHQNFANIRAIHIKDHILDGSGGYASISSGGIGQRYVRIKLESQRGNGFMFTIIIYGRQ